MPRLGDKKYFQFYRMRDYATRAGPVSDQGESREETEMLSRWTLSA
jgi:hypothetical protein